MEISRMRYRIRSKRTLAAIAYNEYLVHDDINKLIAALELIELGEFEDEHN
jgi:hypothetical protein